MVKKLKNLIKANPTHETKNDKILPHRMEGNFVRRHRQASVDTFWQLRDVETELKNLIKANPTHKTKGHVICFSEILENWFSEVSEKIFQ